MSESGRGGRSLTLRGEVLGSDGVQFLAVKHLQLKAVLPPSHLTRTRDTYVILDEGRGGEGRRGEERRGEERRGEERRGEERRGEGRGGEGRGGEGRGGEGRVSRLYMCNYI